MLPVARTRAPIASNYRVQPRQPKISMNGKDTVIEGHELIATISGSTAFASTRYRINPGLALYPWLSERARGWEQYRFERLSYDYVPSDAVTTTPGSVYLAADYDPSDPAPSTLSDMSTYETQANGRVYDRVSLSFSQKEMYRAGNGKKIRCGPVAGDLTLYDSGSLSLATVGCSGAIPLGFLWVSYRIRLFSVQKSSIQSSETVSYYDLSANETFVTGVAKAIAFDDAVVNGLELPAPALGVFTIPCGVFLVNAQATFQDTLNEAFDCDLIPYVDGVAAGYGRASTKTLTYAGGETSVSTVFVFSSNGSTTFSLFALLTGAAGVLTARANACAIAIQVIS